MYVNHKKIVLLLGHPDADSFCGALAESYVSGAQETGHTIQRINIGEMSFDPILHRGYKEVQALEPDLISLQEKIRWADHFVIIYPNWWNTMPAILKGLFDRMWLPGFAFNFDKPTKKLIQRLTGKSARVIVVAGTHSPFQTWWKFGDYANEICRGILEFAGFTPVLLSSFGPSERVDKKHKDNWKEEVFELGRAGL